MQLSLLRKLGVFDPTEKEIFKLPEPPEEISIAALLCVLFVLLCEQEVRYQSESCAVSLLSVVPNTLLSLRCPQKAMFKQLPRQQGSRMTGVAWQVRLSPGDRACSRGKPRPHPRRPPRWGCALQWTFGGASK